MIVFFFELQSYKIPLKYRHEACYQPFFLIFINLITASQGGWWFFDLVEEYQLFGLSFVAALKTDSINKTTKQPNN